MKRFTALLLSIVTILYSLYYISLGGFIGNKSALSTIGLKHPALFWIWGFTAFISLFLCIDTAYKRIDKKLHYSIMLIAFTGMILMLIFKFDYDDKINYYIHCSGAFTMSIAISVAIVMLFIFKKNIFAVLMILGIIVADVILIITFKETALNELLPVFSGLIILNVDNLRKEKDLIGIK